MITMKIKTIYAPIIFVCLLSIFYASGCLDGETEETRETIQDIKRRFEAMEKRLSQLEDIEAIKRLQATYVNFLQEGNYDTIEDILAQEFIFDVRVPGVSPQKMTREEAGKMYRESIAKSHNGKEGDILIEPIIDLDGNRAKGKFVLYFFYYHPETYQTLYFVQSWLDMDYVKEGGEWKISGLGFIPNIAPPGGAPDEETLLNFLDEARKTMRKM
jgi:hypothetical protein